MENYHKIAVKNVAVVNVCFRIEGKMFNEGRIILDIDTYNFAGKLSNDIIFGFYDNGRYTIYYYYKTFGFEDVPEVYDDSEYDEFEEEEIEYEYQEYEIVMTIPFHKNKLPDDFRYLKMEFDEYEISITFDEFESDMDAIQRCLEDNADLIEQRYD